MTDAPERIWLQWEDHAGESTWCQDPINDEDVEYVRADLVAAQLQEARKHLTACLEWMEDGRASTDWGFWDWDENDAYTKARAYLDKYA